ncbi:DUF2510 domain-containing protein [Herbiconiux sp. CPCC 203407]|uniref:DUF2510 domain-containing protein n=1 Tax=Herbiconiux oxytropis TaxID=2970915 RepID=A0AA42BWR1_9MICO|nr:DUF2510 domain-containing protein [Herbiconiux oxytropis]MCS5723023.1 DUF2510 domain-containing protein [Herbiconiux oxytropis]MCS5726908.1 DUF2510 domain-containing protein [Herbiconiux oxytropis]
MSELTACKRESSGSAAAGWHIDSADPTQLRYWDGSSWTTHVAPRILQPGEAAGLVSDYRAKRSALVTGIVVSWILIVVGGAAAVSQLGLVGMSVLYGIGFTSAVTLIVAAAACGVGVVSAVVLARRARRLESIEYPAGRRPPAQVAGYAPAAPPSNGGRRDRRGLLIATAMILSSGASSSSSSKGGSGSGSGSGRSGSKGGYERKSGMTNKTTNPNPHKYHEGYYRKDGTYVKGHWKKYKW